LAGGGLICLAKSPGDFEPVLAGGFVAVGTDRPQRADRLDDVVPHCGDAITLLEQLQVIGKNKAGWLRGSNFIGMLFLGPLIGALLLRNSATIAFSSSPPSRCGVILLAWRTLKKDPRHADLRSCASIFLRATSGDAGEVDGEKPAVGQRHDFGSLNSACFSVFSVFVLAWR